MADIDQVLPPEIPPFSTDASSVPITLDTPPHSPKLNNEEIKIPPHRSHDLSNNLKRSDPFKFGSRYLEPTDDVFEFNAWDHVVPDADYYNYAETQYSKQRASPVSDFDKNRFNSDPAKWWNRFYSNNTANFFKDRKWLQQEFPILCQVTTREAGKKVVLEVGAGAGNTAFPILAANENEELVIHACDFSPKAVEIMKSNAVYDGECIRASVWDISSDELPEGVEEGSVDVVLLVFVFSALSPKQWGSAVRNVWRCLRDGGEVCFRDYGKGDLTQVRFKKERLLEENFYVRGDGTRVYFFEEDELRRIWGGELLASDGRKASEGQTPIVDYERSKEATEKRNGLPNGDAVNGRESNSLETVNADAPESEHAFDIMSLGVDRRMLVNRQKQLKMYRCWIQGRFKKPDATTPD